MNHCKNCIENPESCMDGCDCHFYQWYEERNEETYTYEYQGDNWDSD